MKFHPENTMGEPRQFFLEDTGPRPRSGIPMDGTSVLRNPEPARQAVHRIEIIDRIDIDSAGLLDIIRFLHVIKYMVEMTTPTIPLIQRRRVL